MLGFVGAKEAGLEEKRQYPRLYLKNPLNLHAYLPSYDQPVKAKALNISAKGMLLFSKDINISPGQVLHFDGFSNDNSEISFSGEVKWSKEANEGQISGVFIKDTARLFSYFLLKGLRTPTPFNVHFIQSLIDSYEDAAFFLDKELNVIALSRKQPIISVDKEQVLNKKITDAPSILKLFLKENLLNKKDLLEVLYTNKEKFFKALELDYKLNGESKKFFFNVSIKPISYKDYVDFLLIQVKDVTSLFKLKENIQERNKLHWEQYRFILMGHIVDELLEDIINPLSAVVGRIDLLNMKMANYRSKMPDAEILENWMNELQIIDSLLEQITSYCTIAAKRREREKLATFEHEISLKKLIQETIDIVKINSYFQDIDIELELKNNGPTIEGEYFDWLNALIALLQVIAKGMHTQEHKKISITTDQNEEEIILTISHNAKALRLPLEKEIGLSILELIQKKYNTTIKLSGGSGSQQLSFFIKKTSS